MYLRTLLTLLLLGAIAAGGVLVGCERQPGEQMRAETDEAAYRRGASLQREGRLDEALIAFQNVVENRRDAAESHLELGRLYLDHVKDPISAIYHLRQYLALRPNSENSALVRQLIDTATKDFARSLPAEPFGDRFDRLDLLDTIDTLRAENQDLKRQLAAAGVNRPAATPPAAAAARRAAPTAGTQVASATPASTASSYTVVGGDTLSSISRKVYGTPNRVQDIFNANRDQLANPNDLKVGMQLKIPR
jgi:LysM repeat protein